MAQDLRKEKCVVGRSEELMEEFRDAVNPASRGRLEKRWRRRYDDHRKARAARYRPEVGAQDGGR